MFGSDCANFVTSEGCKLGATVDSIVATDVEGAINIFHDVDELPGALTINQSKYIQYI